MADRSNVYRAAIAALALSASGFVGIISFEGYTENAVIPVRGDVPTAGFGTTEGVTMKTKLPPVQAVQRARMDAVKYEAVIKRCVTVPLAQNEYDAYVSLAYNIGPTAFCGSTLVRKLNDSDYAGACAEILRWDRFHGKPLRGLTLRREHEYDLCTGAIQ